MKLSIVIPVHNQFELSRTAIEWAVSRLSGNTNTEVIVINNGSDKPFPYFQMNDRLWIDVAIPPSFAVAELSPVEVPMEATTKTTTIRVVHLKENRGVYPLFWEALKHSTGNIIAVLHSDLLISEKGWDERVLERFANNDSLGLVGFIGSNEIDAAGGRGLGTTSNFQGDAWASKDETGKEYSWQGSHARVHGKVDAGYSRAAVVDGCAMVFRRSVLEALSEREDFPPHHFYDRLLSCEVREKYYEVGVLGIACDHISGQTVNQEPTYSVMAEKWATQHGLKMEPHHNWDTVLYRTAESMWLGEYRDIKHLVPCKV